MRIEQISLLTALFVSMCASVATAQTNGGFESGLTFWNAVPAANASIETTSSAGFPSEGNQYARLTSAGTGPTLAGYGPHVAGVGTGQVAKLSRSFTRPASGRCEVQIDWAFFHEESPLSFFNDFLSIDIIAIGSGALVGNMVFCDSGSSMGTPFYTGVPGAGGGEIPLVRTAEPGFSSSYEPLPLGMKRARMDLTSVPPLTTLRIEISIANGGDSAAASDVYIDNFRLLSGGVNDGRGSLRVLGSAHADGAKTTGDSGADYELPGPIDFRAMPGQRLALRANATSGGLGWALLSGDVLNDGSDFGFDDFNLSVAGGISVIIDGLNPTTPLDVILGTLTTESLFIEGSLPIDVPDGDLGLIGVMEDPTNGPLFLNATSTTRLEIRDEVKIPVGDTQVLDSGGNPLGLDDFGAVDLTSLNSGGGFTFYGVTYTQCFVGSNGYVTFGAGDTDFNESLADMYTQEPRIAVLWQDFDPSVTTEVLIEADTSSSFVVTISWIGLTEFSEDHPGNRFSVQLFADGSIAAYYDSLTVQAGLVGISPGGLMVPSNLVSNIDFSNSNTHDGSSAMYMTGTPVAQQFGIGAGVAGPHYDRNDLMTLGVNGPSRICYVPRDVGGYRVFCGTR